MQNLSYATVFFIQLLELPAYLLGGTFCKFSFASNNLKTKYECGSKIISYSASRPSSGYIYIYISLCHNSPKQARPSSLSGLHEKTRQESSGRVISSVQRPVPDNTQQSQETYINARQDSNPQSQEASCRRPTPLTSRPLGFASGILPVLNIPPD